MSLKDVVYEQLSPYPGPGGTIALTKKTVYAPDHLYKLVDVSKPALLERIGPRNEGNIVIILKHRNHLKEDSFMGRRSFGTNRRIICVGSTPALTMNL